MVVFAYWIWIEPDWNVKFIFTECDIRLLHLNRTRLECKEDNAAGWVPYGANLNRTRLECKAKRKYIIVVSVVLIWIEPDWNVKTSYTHMQGSTVIIWIEPDWNVKALYALSIKTSYPIWIEPDWNVKYRWYHHYGFYPLIWIEPDWNVKLFMSLS